MTQMVDRLIQTGLFPGSLGNAIDQQCGGIGFTAHNETGIFHRAMVNYFSIQ